MTPDSIILLDPNARLDALIELMQDALARAKAQGYGIAAMPAWDAHQSAWERLHAELMSQVDKPRILTEQDMDMSQVEGECDKCGYLGHLAKDCPQLADTEV
jgi:zinc knuckle protein